jgi:hypothetical protein
MYKLNAEVVDSTESRRRTWTADYLRHKELDLRRPKLSVVGQLIP